MIREAEMNAEADKKKKESADLRNESDNFIFQAKKALDDLKDEVTEEEKESVNKAITELEEVLKGEDLTLIREKKEALEKASQSIAIKAYEKANKEKEASSKDSKDNSNGPVDAEFTDKN
jgi:molecular chaperone DnaK